MNKKKIKYISNLLFTFSLVPIILSVNSCSKNNEENNNLINETKRINDLKLKLKTDKITQTQFDQMNENNILDYLDNWNPKEQFIYKIVNFHKSNEKTDQKKLDFQIEISEKKNILQNQEYQLSNVFSFSVIIIEIEDVENVINSLNNEINRINNINNLQLKKNEFTSSEIDSITDENFIEYLDNLNQNNDFNYYIKNLNKQNKEFNFYFQLTDKNNSTIKSEFSKKFTLNYLVKDNGDTDSSSIREEVERLNKQKPVLAKQNITKEELLEIDIDNLFSKLINLNLNPNGKFQYLIEFLTKNTHTNDNYLNFKIKVISKDVSKRNVDNLTNDYKISFNLIKAPSIEEKVEKDYFKNNLDPITSGANSFATPGTNGQSIIPSNGPSRTEPAEGIEENAKLSKGIIYNQTELNQLKNTFSLGFQSYNSGYAFGTGWILDYKLSDDNTYPVTWYIATNAHVIQNLKVENDKITPDRFEKENEKYKTTQQLRIETVKNPEINKSFGNNSENPENFKHALIPANKLKTVFIGNDYLTTSPGMFSNKNSWANNEEYIDFAVMEITFSTPEEAKDMTSDYVNDSQRHFKYKEKSLVLDTQKQNYYSVMGFPVTGQPSSYWRPTELTSTRAVDSNNQLINSDKEKLSNLSKGKYYNTFNNITGVFDAALGLSFFGYNYRQAYELTTFYNSWGLVYPIDYGNLGPGSSGSMMIDKDGYTWGIHFAADPRASTGLSAALYSEGFNYQGKFGEYNLEGYDLIKGGFPNQKKSYKSELKKLYGDSFKTKLFPNGLN